MAIPATAARRDRTRLTGRLAFNPKQSLKKLQVVLPPGLARPEPRSPAPRLQTSAIGAERRENVARSAGRCCSCHLGTGFAEQEKEQNRNQLPDSTRGSAATT